MLTIALMSGLIGILVGLTGIGGVLIIPAVIVLSGMPPHTVISTALASFLLVGAVGTVNYARMKALRKEIWLPLCLGGLPCAFIGAKFNTFFPASLLLFLLGCIIILAGVSALRPWKALDRFNITRSSSARWIIMSIGAFAGILAGLTGAGGPVLTIPIMIALGLPPLLSVAAGMPFQVATSIGGTWGSLFNGTIEPSLLFPLGIPIVIGLLIGNRLITHIPALWLKRGIGLLCLLTGIYQCIRAF